MLNREEVERLIRISRDQCMDYAGEYESTYTRVDKVRGHKARMEELSKIESEQRAKKADGLRTALHLLFVLNGNDYQGCKLADHISCKVCPFSLGGPCALKSIVGLGRHDKEPAGYPRDCMEDIARGCRALAWEGISDEQVARIKRAVNILHREEGKPEVQ